MYFITFSFIRYMLYNAARFKANHHLPKANILHNKSDFGLNMKYIFYTAQKLYLLIKLFCFLDHGTRGAMRI